MNRLVVISCGSKKLEHAAPAAELYTGHLFRSQLAWARSVVPDAAIRILSARHGLVRLDTVLAPYDTRLGHPDSISRDGVQVQAIEERLVHVGEVIVVGGRDYVRLAREVWPDALSFTEEAGGCTSLGAFRGRLRACHGQIPFRVIA